MMEIFLIKERLVFDYLNSIKDHMGNLSTKSILLFCSFKKK